MILCRGGLLSETHILFLSSAPTELKVKEGKRSPAAGEGHLLLQHSRLSKLSHCTFQAAERWHKYCHLISTQIYTQHACMSAVVAWTVSESSTFSHACHSFPIFTVIVTVSSCWSLPTYQSQVIPSLAASCESFVYVSANFLWRVVMRDCNNQCNVTIFGRPTCISWLIWHSLNV